MKAENNGKMITQFADLRSKIYSSKVGRENHKKKAKGVEKLRTETNHQ